MGVYDHVADGGISTSSWVGSCESVLADHESVIVYCILYYICIVVAIVLKLELQSARWNLKFKSHHVL